MLTAQMRFEMEADGLRKGYDLFISQMDTGNILFTSTDNRDYTSGENFGLEVKNWMPSLFQYKGKFPDTTRYPATALSPIPAICTVDVTFESGEVLAADWFFNDDFTELSKNDCSINSLQGRIEATEFYARLGFVSVCVGNSSPSLWKQSDKIIVGRENDEDEPNTDLEYCRYVTTDLWWVTMIDRKQLERMIGTEVVAAYLAEKEPMTFQITPGTYTVSYHPEYNNFYQNYESKGLEVLFAMEKKK